MKIKKLQIKNFQSHKDTALEFDEGLNIIVGPTNSGKSSILRALKKVIRDSPSGNNFVNVDANECSISIETDKDTIERHIVVASTGETKTNEYTLNGELFAKFGKEIPLEVIRTLKMPEVEFDNSKIDLNFADQFEGPFLLASPPSLKARVLGKLSGVDILDSAIVQVNKSLRKLSGDIKESNEKVEILEKELSEFIDIEKREQDLKELKQGLDEVEKSLSLVEELQRLESSLKKVASDGKNVKKELKSLKEVDSISFDKVEGVCSSLQEIKTLYTNISVLDSKERTLQNELNKLETLGDFETTFDFVKIGLSQLENLQNLEKQLVVIEKVKEYEKNIKTLDGSIDTKVGELQMFLKELGVCPFCGQNLSDTIVKEICGE